MKYNKINKCFYKDINYLIISKKQLVKNEHNFINS